MGDSRNTGQLVLAFANTADWHASAHPEESLTSYPKLMEWAKKEAILTPGEARQLLMQAEAQPEEARSVLKQAVELREAIYHILSDRAHELPARPDDLAVVNGAISAMMAHSRLVVDKKGGFTWGWDDGSHSMDGLMWPVVHSAGELLTDGDKLDRVGQCADERGCGWLFMDTSKNRSRRWCDMKDCGNRAKARRHYRKRQSETGLKNGAK